MLTDRAAPAVRRRRLCSAPGLPELVEELLNALGAGGVGPLVDRQCLAQLPGGLAGAAVVEVAMADSFQGACFLEGHAGVAGDGNGKS